MKISRNWLQEYFTAPLPKASDLANLFNTHAFEVEGVEEVGKDSVLDMKVLPDRAHYALCHYGVAREVRAITGIVITKSAIPTISVDKNVKPVDVKIDSPLCARYMARRIEHVSVTDSPIAIKEKLEAVGQRSINSIVDATNYVMLDIGQPLHAFDADKVQGNIVVRLAQTDEKITLLDGREMNLLVSDLVIADDAGPLAIAGVKGGKRAEVTATTKNIIIESANFNSVSVRKTATRLNLRNDSSKRFENAISPELCAEAMERVTTLVGGSAGPVADMYPQPAKPWSVSVSAQQVARTIGIQISSKEIKEILERMDCKVAESGDMLTVTPPYDRLDILIPEDIADEVGRIYGYDKVPSVLPPKLAETIPVDKVFYYAEKVKNILVENGYSEVMLYSLVPKGVFQIAYPLASDKAALREAITPKMTESLTLNSRNKDLLELDTIKIFEIGKVFPKTGEHTSLAMTGKTDVLEKALGVKISSSEVNFDELVKDLPDPKDISDLNFKPLARDLKYKPFSLYPFASRDVAVFVPKATAEKTVKDLIVSKAGKYLLKIRLFDTFPKGEEVSYAYRLVFQSYEKTLDESEINGAMTAVTEALNAQVGWKVR